MLHLKRALPLLTPAQFGFSGTFQESYLCSAYSTPSLPVLGWQGLSLKVHLLSLDQGFPSLEEAWFPNEQALHCPCPSHHLWLHIRSDWGSGYSRT